MHRSMVYTLGEVGTCIPQLPGSHKVKKKRREGPGGEDDGHGVCRGGIGPQSSVGHGYR